MVLGYIAYLMSILPGYNKWKFERIQSTLVTAIINNNYNIGLDQYGTPTSCITWNFVSKKELENFRDGKGVNFSKAESGRELIITHCMSNNLIPFFRATMKRIALENPDIKIGWGKRGFRDNKLCKIYLPRGKNA